MLGLPRLRSGIKSKVGALIGLAKWIVTRIPQLQVPDLPPKLRNSFMCSLGWSHPLHPRQPFRRRVLRKSNFEDTADI